MIPDRLCIVFRDVPARFQDAKYLSSFYCQVGEAVGAEEVIFYVPADGSTYNFKAHGVSIFGVESEEFFI